MRPLIGQSVYAGTRSDLRTTRTDPRPLGRVRVRGGLGGFWVGSVTCVSPHSVGEPSAKLTYCFQSCRIAPGFAVSDTVLKIPIPVILVRIHPTNASGGGRRVGEKISYIISTMPRV